MLISFAFVDILICADFIVRHQKPKPFLDYLKGIAPGEYEFLLFRRVYIVAVFKGKSYAKHKRKRSNVNSLGGLE